MTYQFLFFSILFSVIIFLSYKLGKTKKELNYIKEENNKLEKEIVYVQETITTIHNLHSDDVNNRLQQIADKK